MKTAVLDAGFLVKRLLAEPDSRRVRAWFNANVATRFVGPSLLFAESGRVLQKALAPFPPTRLKALHSRLLAGIPLYAPHERVWEATEGLTFYDAHYLSLAEALGATLATTDDRLAAAARKGGVPLARF